MYQQKYREASEWMASGEIVDLDEAYVRRVAVPWYLLLVVLLFATIGRVPLFLFAIARGVSTTSGGGRRSLKELREGPSVVVSPMWIKSGDGTVVETEVHGYLAPERLMLGDRVWADLRPQRRPGYPRRAVRIHNLTTGQVVRPHPDTVFGHVGLPLILQASLGVMITTLMVLAWQV